MARLAVVGAGISGAVVAHELTKSGHDIDVFESRPHVAGNCYTRRDKATGVLVHVYGPHIFHTDNSAVWHYIRQFDAFVPFINRVKAVTNGRVFSLPINLLTINQFFSKTLSPTEAEKFLNSVAECNIDDPQTFEQQALRFVGRDLYEAFFKHYTIKQWGMQPSELPASILKRLPIRFNYEDNYYTSKYQGMPAHGYTYIIDRMLDHPAITLHLRNKFSREMGRDFYHVFYSGPIDEWFGYCEGRLGYRTLDFVHERHVGDYQGNPVINYCDDTVPWTRVTEHKHFAPHEKHRQTIISREYSRVCEKHDTPFYPIRLVQEKAQLAKYLELARFEENVTFMGRLGTYRYLDMDVAIAEAIDVATQFLQNGECTNISFSPALETL